MLAGESALPPGLRSRRCRFRRPRTRSRRCRRIPPRPGYAPFAGTDADVEVFSKRDRMRRHRPDAGTGTADGLQAVSGHESDRPSGGNLVRPPPALRSWKAKGHAMLDRGLPTPRPWLVSAPAVARLVQCGLPTVRPGSGRPSPARRRPARADRSRSESCDTLARWVRLMHDRGVSHRDLKAANILIALNGECQFIDLVGVRTRRRISRPSPGTRSGTTERQLLRVARRQLERTGYDSCARTWPGGWRRGGLEKLVETGARGDRGKGPSE